MPKPNIHDPCPGNDRGQHVTPIGLWKCIFCGAGTEGEEFYSDPTLYGGDASKAGKYFIDKNGCRKIGELPEEVRRRSHEELAKIMAWRRELGLSDK